MCRDQCRRGWSLALLGRPLFREPIEAWTNGPVVPDVYQQFRGTRAAITPDVAGEPTESLSPTEAELIRAVWREYARYTPAELVAMTHFEPAWAEARAGLPEGAASNRPLDVDTMRQFFAEKARSTRPAVEFPAIDPAEVWQGDLRHERDGGTVSMAEAMRRAKAARAGV